MMKKPLLTAVVVLAVGGLLGSQWQARYDANLYKPLLESVTKQSKQETASKMWPVMIDFGDKISLFTAQDYLSETTLFELTETLASKNNLKIETKDYGDMGRLVTQIGDKINGQDGKYWQYWINNVQIQESADKHRLKDGDVIMWKFTQSKE